MGLKAVEIVLFFVSLVIAGIVGAALLPGIMKDVKYNIYRASTHSIALDVASFSSLTAIATGDITIDYKIDNNIVHKVAASNRLVNVTRAEDDKQKFSFSIPFSFTKQDKEQRGSAFKISKVYDEKENKFVYRIAEEK